MGEGGFGVSIGDSNVTIAFRGGGAGPKFEEFTNYITCSLDKWDTSEKELGGNRVIHAGKDISADAIKFPHPGWPQIKPWA